MNPLTNQPFEEIGFKLELTHDGSPTLRLLTSGESMHHFDGAAGESWYVYGLPLRQAFLSQESGNFKVASIGLGLGYIEMLWVLLKAQFASKSIQNKLFEMTLDSFEKNDLLQQNFLNWITDKKPPLQNTAAFYDLAFKKLVSVHSQLEISHSLIDFKKHFDNEINGEKLHFNQDLLLYSGSPQWNFICFDAFSKNTDQDLWTSDYLEHFLHKYAAEDCVFTTYAATTKLKNVLQKHQFELIKRLGYSGKRECTLALRGKFMDDAAIFRTF